ncbi:type II toxin-antitoxin system VapC family toxin [Dyadobacter beijingensis]|uniref:type II toxin-antitoxin system VapC family toxin n=1 Tax=Dyadobacter beijingensis TaxID=365489 RepID=UPI00039A3163|nr:type II toxin-antitoxin system VapC family toxin [Dyadobacter beijingensis]
MIYFDSDVIFNFLVIQDARKHEESRTQVLGAIAAGEFAISSLVIQEVGFGLAKFGISAQEIAAKLAFLLSINTVEIVNADINRAIQLAEQIGFKHINDCVHTAVAERMLPDRLVTYNKADFGRIKKMTKIRVKIL